MKLTNKQREEMRKCVVGPCTFQEKQDMREWLGKIGERIEPDRFWNWKKLDLVRFDTDYHEWWSTGQVSNISFQDFKTKYIDAAK